MEGFPGRESLRVSDSVMIGTMSSLTRQIVIDGPADTVWEVLAGRFDRIGEWATAILGSSLGVADPDLIALDAPIAARVCETGIRALPQVTKTIVEFDASNRSLTYKATGGTRQSR